MIATMRSIVIIFIFYRYYYHQYYKYHSWDPKTYRFMGSKPFNQEVITYYVVGIGVTQVMNISTVTTFRIQP